MRTHYFYALAFLGLFLILLQASCNPDDYGPCDRDPTSTPDRGFVFFSMVLPDTNEEINLLDVLRYPCDRDSVKVYDENGDVPGLYEFDLAGRIAFRATYDDQIHRLAFEQEVSRQFQLYINHQEIHWIELRYRLREVKCEYDVFQYIEVYYDNELFIRSEDLIRIPPILIERDSLAYSRCL